MIHWLTFLNFVPSLLFFLFAALSSLFLASRAPDQCCLCQLLNQLIPIVIILQPAVAPFLRELFLFVLEGFFFHANLFLFSLVSEVLLLQGWVFLGHKLSFFPFAKLVFIVYCLIPFQIELNLSNGIDVKLIEAEFEIYEWMVDC